MGLIVSGLWVEALGFGFCGFGSRVRSLTVQGLRIIIQVQEFGCTAYGKGLTVHSVKCLQRLACNV